MARRTKLPLFIALVALLMALMSCSPAAPQFEVDSHWRDDGGGLIHRDIDGVRCFHMQGQHTLSCVKL